MTRKQYDKCINFIAELKGYDEKKIDYSREYYKDSVLKKLKRICRDKIRFNSEQAKNYRLIPYFEIDNGVLFMNPPSDAEIVGTLYLFPPVAMALMLSKYSIVNELISQGYPLSTSDNFMMRCTLIPEEKVGFTGLFNANDRYESITFWDDEPWQFLNTVDILSIAIKSMNAAKINERKQLAEILKTIYTENRINLYSFAENVLTEEYQIGQAVTIENAIKYYDKFVLKGDAAVKEKYDRCFIKIIENLVLLGEAYSRKKVYRRLEEFLPQFLKRIGNEKLIEKLFYVLIPQYKEKSKKSHYYNNFAYLLWGEVGQCIDERVENKSIKDDKVIADIDIILFIITLYIKRYVIGGEEKALEANYSKIKDEFDESIVDKGIFSWQQIGIKAVTLLADRGYIKDFEAYDNYLEIFKTISGEKLFTIPISVKYTVLNNILLSIKQNKKEKRCNGNGRIMLECKNPIIKILEKIPDDFLITISIISNQDKKKKMQFIRNLMPLASEDVIEICFDKGIVDKGDVSDLITCCLEMEEFSCVPFLKAIGYAYNKQ